MMNDGQEILMTLKNWVYPWSVWSECNSDPSVRGTVWSSGYLNIWRLLQWLFQTKKKFSIWLKDQSHRVLEEFLNRREIEKSGRYENWQPLEKLSCNLNLIAYRHCQIGSYLSRLPVISAQCKLFLLLLFFLFYSSRVIISRWDWLVLKKNVNG